MANTLGALVVRLGLDSAEFTSGLTKSEYAAQKFARNLDTQFRSVARSIAALGGGAALGVFIHDVVASAAALDDLADSTGSSVENLSKLANQAKISGTDFATLEGLMHKLSAGMAGADDESSNVGRALKALGVTTRDPAQALQEIAVALDKYADGVGKAAIARDLFGKGGVAFLATLKDIAEAQDIAASVTTKQAAEAEALQKALRRLTIEGLAELKTAILSGLVPALVEMLRLLRDARDVAGELAGGLKALAQLSPFKSAGENIAQMNTEIEKLEQTIAGVKSGSNFWVKFFGTSQDTSVLERQLATLKQARDIAERSQLRGFGGPPTNERIVKPGLGYTGGGDPKKAKAEADEFAKAMERVRQSSIDAGIALREAFSGEKFTAAQKALEQIQGSKAWATMDEGQRRAITTAYEELAVTERQTEALNKGREAREKVIKGMHDQAEAETKLRNEAIDSLKEMTKRNDQFEAQIGIIGKGEQAWALLNAEQEHNTLIAKANAAGQLEVVAGLELQYDRQKKLLTAYYAAQETLERQIEINRIFAESFADALSSVVLGTKSLSQAFKDMTKSIVEDITRIASRRIANAILGVDAQGGGGIGEWIGKFLPMLFGGSTGGTTLLPTGPMPPVQGFANGTSFAPGGLALVGERGPEIVNLPRGSKVTPNSKLAPVINIAVHQAPGASRASSEQLAAETGRAVQRAMRSVR